MKALKTGPNVIAILGEDAARTYAVDYDAIPGFPELVTALLNPFSRRRLPQVPNVVQVIMLSMLANQQPDLRLGDTDILVRPELPQDVYFTSWEKHREIFLHAYRYTTEWIRARKEEMDPGWER